MDINQLIGNARTRIKGHSKKSGYIQAISQINIPDCTHLEFTENYLIKFAGKVDLSRTSILFRVVTIFTGHYFPYFVFRICVKSSTFWTFFGVYREHFNVELYKASL